MLRDKEDIRDIADIKDTRDISTIRDRRDRRDRKVRRDKRELYSWCRKMICFTKIREYMLISKWTYIFHLIASFSDIWYCCVQWKQNYYVVNYATKL